MVEAGAGKVDEKMGECKEHQVRLFILQWLSLAFPALLTHREGSCLWLTLPVISMLLLDAFDGSRYGNADCQRAETVEEHFYFLVP